MLIVFKVKKYHLNTKIKGVHRVTNNNNKNIKIIKFNLSYGDMAKLDNFWDLWNLNPFPQFLRIPRNSCPHSLSASRFYTHKVFSYVISCEGQFFDYFHKNTLTLIIAWIWLILAELSQTPNSIFLSHFFLCFLFTSELQMTKCLIRIFSKHNLWQVIWVFKSK